MDLTLVFKTMKIDYHKVKSFWCIHINFMKTFKTVWIGSKVSKLIYSWYNCACDHLKIPTIPLNEPLKGCKDVITTQKISFPPHDFGSSSNFWDQKVSKLSLLTFEKWPLPSLPAGDFQKKVCMQKAFFHMQKFNTAKTELWKMPTAVSNYGKPN